MAPPTLVAMSQRGLIRNLANLQDVGDTRYELVRPALRKIMDPQQLRAIEIASPHIADADEELWLAFIQRDIPDWKRKFVRPKNPRSWWKVYRKLYREEKAAQEEQQKQLLEALQGKKKEKEENQTHILSTVVQQRFRQKTMLDGVANPRAGSLGYERVGTVASARKNGKNIISAIRKASTKPTAFRTAVNTGETVQAKMWQQPIIPPSTRRKPNLLRRGAPTEAEKSTQSALDRALKADEKIKQERAKRLSNSPPPLPIANAARQPQSSPKSQPARSTSTAPGVAQRTKPVAGTAPPSAATLDKPASTLGPGAGSKRPLSPEKSSPASPQKRARPQTSIFMPKRIKR